MPTRLKSVALSAAALFLFSCVAFAQVSSLEGDVKDENGQPLKGALVKIDRKDIKGHYQVKTDKKGHYFHTGLPLGTYKVTLEVDGKDVDNVDNVRTSLGDSQPINFDLQATKKRNQSLQQAAANGTMTKEQERGMSAEQKAALEKATKEREAALSKNKALNDAFNQGMTAMQGKQWDAAVDAFNKANELDPKQTVIWAHLADSYIQLGATKTGADQEAAYAKGLEAFNKAIELKPDDASYHNNYALALVKTKKIPEAQAELTKAAQLDPPNAGKYYYNLGAVMVNSNQNDAAGQAFKKAIELDPNYADAQYQYGMYLLGQAKITPEGKVIPADGTKEALQKYLELKPTGPFADSAKGALASIEGSVSTTYENPDAAKNKKGKKKSN
jgi:tetratricopeptide (TPR) repeat protein